MPKSVTLSGFGFDWDAAAVRLEAECVSRGISTRAQFVAAYNAATDAARLRFLARVIFGAVVLPDDNQGRQDAGYIAGQGTIA